jgi:hypothetical protein
MTQPSGTSHQGVRVLDPLITTEPVVWRKSVLVEFYTNEQPFPHLLPSIIAP